MFGLLILCALAVDVFSFPHFHHAAPAGRIVGGQPANISDYPYQVAVQYCGKVFCGGTLVSRTVVITAAHCAPPLDIANLTIRAGTSMREKGGQVVKVAKIHIHPGYIHQDIGILNDISVLELSEPIIHENAEPIELAPLGYVAPENVTVTISGFGVTGYGLDAEIPETLLVAQTKVVSNEHCDKAYPGQITDTAMCAGEPGVGVCYGDSGGPLIVDGRLTGVVSWGKKCAEPGFPQVYVAIGNSKIRNFIKDTVGL